MDSSPRLIVLCTEIIVKRHTNIILMKFLIFLKLNIIREEYRLKVPPKKKYKVANTKTFDIHTYKNYIDLIRNIIMNDNFDFSTISSKYIMLMRGLKQIINTRLKKHFTENLNTMNQRLEALEKSQSLSSKKEIDSINRYIIYFKKLIKSFD